MEEWGRAPWDVEPVLCIFIYIYINVLEPSPRFARAQVLARLDGRTLRASCWASGSPGLEIFVRPPPGPLSSWGPLSGLLDVV
eukprot:6132124-Pyramimonas_sp.AAC.1